MNKYKCVQCWRPLDEGKADQIMLEEGMIGLVPIHKNCKKNLDVERIKENLRESDDVNIL